MKRLAVVLPVLVLFFTIETSWGGVPWRSRTLAPGTLEVTNGDDDGPGSLRQAIRDATPDSTIEFTFTGTISLTSDELLIDKNLTITGPGSSLLAVSRDVDGAPAFRLLEVGSGVAVSVSGMTLSNGVGGILNGGVLSLNDVQIINDGLGCMNSSGAQMTITNCSVTGNESKCGSFPIYYECGGGIINNGDLTVQSSTISGNTTGYGGGIFSDGTATITNCTISGNAAVATGAHGFQGGYGGGLNLSGPTTLVSDTISGNSAVWQGGGIIGEVTLTNCILAGNSASAHPENSDLSGTVQSEGYNLVGVSIDGDGFGANDLTGTVDAPLDARLGPLQDNGGLTFTLALLPGSPAIDQGVSQGLSTDQRGMPRTADQPNISNASGGDGTDIGAFELPVVAPTLGNISTRLLVGTGDNVLIGGFIVTGTQPKKVILRAIGPSLQVPGAMADPTLELHDSSQAVIAINDNWQDSPDKQAIIDSTLAPTDDHESAIVMTLDPGSYTAILQGANSGTGVALVEVYDLDQASDSKLGNLSTRGLVQTDNDVMIGGVIVLGTEPTNSIIRAIGPSLPLTDPLADPLLELHDSDGAIVASNDNWKDTQEAEIEATSLAPTNDFESAIAATLAPGAYTAIVRGKNNTTGVALVEVYALAAAFTGTPSMFVVDESDNSVTKANLDGTDATDLGNIGGFLNNPIAIAINASAGKMYVCNSSGNSVTMSNLDGSSPVNLTMGGMLDGPGGIALDVPRNMMYVSLGFGPNVVVRANLDGSGAVGLGDFNGLVSGLLAYGMDIDVAGGKMDIAVNGGPEGQVGKIVQADLPDGANPVALDFGGLLNGKIPLDVKVDAAGNEMYVLDFRTGFLYRADLNGNGAVSLGSPAGSFADYLALDVVGGKMYISALNQVTQADLPDGANPITLDIDSLGFPGGVAIYRP